MYSTVNQRVSSPAATLYQQGRLFLLILMLLLTLLFYPLTGCAGKQPAPVTPLDVHNLAGRRIGVLMSWSPDYILEDVPGIELQRYDTTSDAILALKYRRIEALAMDIINAKNFCRMHPGYKILEEPVAFDDYIIFVTNKRQDILQQFNEFAADFRTSEEYQDIYARIMAVDRGEYVRREWPKHTTGPVLNVATNSLAYPYASIDLQTGEFFGSSVEIIEHFAWRYGYQIHFLDGDYEAGILNLTTGKADLRILALSQAYRFEVELTHKAMISEPYFSTSIVLVVISDRSQITFDNPELIY